ncbi:Crp/Fnr family transcriptional regulator [Streptomyces xanthophaeus]|uniref:Crp/Fnr family transcriptional regulator n=1 Tax=Streptomyces xanthophaeus TaxID=67385 RepID=UPI00387049FF|nr:Crp/Fnr family transcriptional regulator [Streptomyces xanthophaeus]WST60895.1 Crp/Fnr family transcriptional regulator [Streptomyces xanthophaeus]
MILDQSAGGDGGLDDRVPFLARLEDVDGAALRALGRELTYPPRTPLLHQDEPTAHVLLILTGWTKVTAAYPNGYQALLALRGPGDIIGESAALTRRPRSASVTALEQVRAVVIEHEAFRTFLTHCPSAALQLLALTADRQRTGDRRRLEFAALSVRERLAVLLLELAQLHGRRTAEGVEVSVALTKQELAGAVGASREMVQRQLKDLRDRGVVNTGRRELVIVRPDVLRRIAGAQPPAD